MKSVNTPTPLRVSPRLILFIFSVVGLLTGLALGLFGNISCSTRPIAGSASPQANESGSDLSKTEAFSRSQRLSGVAYTLSLDIVGASGNSHGAPKAAADSAAEITGHQTVSFDLAADTSTGSAEMAGQINRDLRIDFFEGAVTAIEVNRKPISSAAKKPYSIVIPAQALRVGRNDISIKYSQKFSQTGQGLHRFQDPLDGKVYLYTQFEAFDANRFMPCFDQPDLRSTLELSVVAPANWSLVTTTMETSRRKGTQPASEVWTFAKTPPLATYLFSLHAGPYASFKTKTAAGLPLRLFVRQSLKQLVHVDDWFTFTKQGLAFYEKYFDQKYPFSKLDQLIVPEFNAGGMENAAAITYSEWTLPRSTPTRPMRRNLSGLVLHEIAHMWFGDLVTMAWWNDLWLNESFATYMSMLAMVEATEFKEGWQAFASGVKSGAYAQDAMSTTHPIEAIVNSVKEAESNFDGITYNKGASVIKQLAYFVTEDAFQRGIQDYFKKHAFKNTTLADFIAAIQTHTKKDLGLWAARWLRQSGVDTVSTDWTCDGDRLHSIRGHLETLKGREFRPQSIQVGLYKGTASKLDVIEKLRLDFDNRTDVTITGDWACPDFVYANQDDYGYVNVALDKTSVEFVSQHISAIANAITRAQIWNDLWRMVRNTELSLKTYVSAVEKGLPEENNDLILQHIVRTIERPQSSVLAYWPATGDTKKDRVRFLTALETEFLKRISASKSGSDEEKFWYDGFTRIVSLPNGLNQITAWYKAGRISKNFSLDLDRKWTIASLLSRYWHPAAESIALALQRADRSDRGLRSALSVAAVRPDPALKGKLIGELRSLDPKKPLHDFQAVAYSLFPPEQVDLRLSFEKTFYAFLEKHRNSEDERRVGSFVEGLTPLSCEQTHSVQLKESIAKLKDIAPVLKKNLLMDLDEDERCQRIRKYSGL